MSRGRTVSGWAGSRASLKSVWLQGHTFMKGRTVVERVPHSNGEFVKSQSDRRLWFAGSRGDTLGREEFVLQTPDSWATMSVPAA